MTGATDFFRRLLADVTANVLPLAAMAIVASAGLIGSGIDMGRAWRVENRLQAACDAGVLAGRRAVGSSGYDSSAKAQATTYFNTNFSQSRLEAHDTTFVTEAAENANVINGRATTQIDTAVMQMFGFDDFNLSVDCTASMGVGNSDVVMVLDTTGSMDTALDSGTRISALRGAMKNFYDTVKTATQGSNSRVRYGFVPFSQAVNVGGLLMANDPEYISDTYSVQTRRPIWKDVPQYNAIAMNYEDGPYYEYSSVTTGSRSDYDSTNYSSESGCTSALPGNLPWEKSGDPTKTTKAPTSSAQAGGNNFVTQQMKQKQVRTIYACEVRSSSPLRYRRYKYPQTRYATFDRTSEYELTGSLHVFGKWEYKEYEYATDRYKLGERVVTDTGTNGANVTSAVWNGCIEERGTINTATYSYSSITGMSPSDAFDLNIDLGVDDAVDETKWKPMWNEVAYYRTGDSASVTSSGSKAGYACPYAARLMAEMDESEFDAYADSLFATGSTYLDLGMIWGGRLSSPDGIFKDNVTIDPNNGGEVSRHLIFMTDGEMDPTQNSQTSYGIEQTDRRIGDGTDATAKTRHLARFQAVCEAIKDKQIRVWVIAFTTGLSTHLEKCASDNSAFTARSAPELNAAFQEIAKQVGELRITQ